MTLLEPGATVLRAILDVAASRPGAGEALGSVGEATVPWRLGAAR